MDFKTVILMLAVGSFSFGLLILLFKFSLGKPQLAPYWVEAKMLKAAGSLLLYLHADSFDILSMVANTALLLGCAYEAWAVRVLNGLTVRRRLHLWAASAIVALSAAFFYLKEPYRAGAYFLGHSILFARHFPFTLLRRKVLAAHNARDKLQRNLGGVPGERGIVLRQLRVCAFGRAGRDTRAGLRHGILQLPFQRINPAYDR